MRKSLHYRIVSQTALFSVKEEVKKEFEITYKGKKIEEAQLVLIEISNTGNLPIEAEDYKIPISFNFGEEAQVLTAEVIKTIPEELHASVSTDEGIVLLTPILTNPGDSLTLKIIVSELGEEIKASSRMVGANLEESKPTMNLREWLLLLLMIVSYGCMFLFFLIVSSNPILGIILLLGSMVGLGTTAALSLVFLVQRLRLRRKRQDRFQ
jgi:hypothetical protein